MLFQEDNHGEVIERDFVCEIAFTGLFLCKAECPEAHIQMLGSKGILTPLIPDCYVLCTLAILKNIRNPLIFL